MNEQTTPLGKIFTKHTEDKGLVSVLYKVLLQTNSKKKIQKCLIGKELEQTLHKRSCMNEYE